MLAFTRCSSVIQTTRHCAKEPSSGRPGRVSAVNPQPAGDCGVGRRSAHFDRTNRQALIADRESQAMTAPQPLVTALADRYRIERPLGVGGMATVYLAEDLKHQRKVALKVLKPEFAEALGPQRFLHEIKLVAQLNHPHILALHDSGEADGYLYFVMPVVEGESLRVRLDRDRQLAIDDAVRLTQQIAEALEYAHRQGVLHRDIKPENILLHEGEAMVTDFGIALPMDAATDTRLTEAGESLGTADYMSPEQSKGERTLDARTDVYALGCVLFEMLAGEPPFTGHNRQSVIGKRITEPPPRVTTRRVEVPEALGDVVTKALAMSPADRYDSAAAFAEALAHQATGATGPLTRVNHPVTAAALFGLVSLAIVGAVYFIMVQLGLPDWVLRAAIGLLVIGLPIIVSTAFSEWQRAARASRQHRWLNWRRALQGGGLAFVGLGLVTAAFMAMRSLGIGPVGTLMAKGVLQSRDPILLAEFENQTSDPTLAATITNGLRIDLSQSRVVRLIDPATVTAALKRMVVDPDTVLNEALARQVAEREGLKAVLAGEVSPAGSGYLLLARLISPGDGALLAAERASAKDNTELIFAIDELSAKLRARIGESLKDVRASPALSRVTTSSLEALRKYTRAVYVDEHAGAPARAVPLLEEAVSLDTNFAMAYRKLGNVLPFLGRNEASIEALTRAFELRERLPERERYHVDAYYHGAVEYDLDKLIRAYRSMLTLDPDDYRALTNLASNLSSPRLWAERESLALRAIDAAGPWQSYANAIFAQALQGKFIEAHATLDRFAEAIPGNPRVRPWRANLLLAQREYGQAEALLEEYIADVDRSTRSGTMHNGTDGGELSLGDLMQLRGRVTEAERWFRTSRVGVYSLLGFEAIYHLAKLERVRRRSGEATRLLDSYVVDSLAPADRPYLELAEFHAASGDVDRAKALIAEYQQHVPDGLRKRPVRRQALHRAHGEIALSESRFDDAVAAFTIVNELSGQCVTCGLAQLAHARIRSGQPDSALSVYVRLVTAPTAGLQDDEVRWLPEAYRRLGELYEERNDTTKAVAHYNEFVELWKDADPELQQQVADVRARIARLVGES